PRRRDALLDADAEGRIGRELLARGLHRALQLNFAQALGGAAGASAQVFIQRACFGSREFPVRVSIEFFSPTLAGHDLRNHHQATQYFNSFASVARYSAKPGGRVTNATSRCPSERPGLQKFPDTTFLQIHTAATPRDTARAAGPKPPVPTADPSAAAGCSLGCRWPQAGPHHRFQAPAARSRLPSNRYAR